MTVFIRPLDQPLWCQEGFTLDRFTTIRLFIACWCRDEIQNSGILVEVKTMTMTNKAPYGKVRNILIFLRFRFLILPGRLTKNPSPSARKNFHHGLLAVDILAVPDLDDQDGEDPVLDLVDDAVVSLANAVALLLRELFAAGRSWGVAQPGDPIDNALPALAGQRLDLFRR